MSAEAHLLTSLNSGLIVNDDLSLEEGNGPHMRYSLAEEIDDEVFPAIKHKQAALLLCKGQDNEKITSPVSDRVAELAYKIVHHPAYLWFNFLTTLVLLLLAFGEQPSVYRDVDKPATDKLPANLLKQEKTCIVAVELVLLLLLTFNLVLRLIWEPKLFIRSRGILVAIIIFVMMVEAVVILVQQKRHMRFTRALRPFLLLDTFLMSGVRRVVRQIFLCLKYILDVLLILFFLIAIFSIMGYFFFAETDSYFEDLGKSFVSMLITLTTANHPDVFLEAYLTSPVAPLFFIVYMFVTFYYFSNVLLAVVFAKFKQADKQKYKDLYLHRRTALKQAFHTLKGVDGVSLVDFICCIQQFKPQITTHEAMCVFKSLKQVSEEMDMNNHFLSWDEFSNLYDTVGMKWALTHAMGGFEVSWYDEVERLSPMAKASLKTIHNGIRHWLFDSIMTFIILLNLLYLVLFIIVYNEKKCDDESMNSTATEKHSQFCPTRQKESLIGSFIFICIYVIEVSMRIFFDGFLHYLRKLWNIIDFLLVMVSFGCLIAEASIIHHYDNKVDDYNHDLSYLAVARPLVLLRLLKLKRNYLYLLRIMIVLVERMISVFFLLIIVCYFYAIIGMEVFSGDGNSVAFNCCHDAWYDVHEYYSNNGSEDNPNLFWLNNFNNLWDSYVTLYELMVVNNWFIIMEGFVFTTSNAARVYFIFFWITTTLVVNTAIVYIVDAFESGLLALNTQEQTNNESGENLKRVIHLTLTADDINELQRATYRITCTEPSYTWRKIFSSSHLIRQYKTLKISTIKKHKGQFKGKRVMDDHDLRQFIYSTDIELWKEEFEASASGEQLPSKDIKNFTLSFKEVRQLLWTKTKQVVYYFLG